MINGIGRAGYAIWDVLLAERPQWAHWLPVGIGTGIAIYFSLPTEPALWLGCICTVACLILYILIRSDVGKLCTFVLISISLGLAVAQWRTEAVKTPFIHERSGPVRITGEIDTMELREKGARLVLSSLSIDRVDTKKTPGKIRLSLKGDGSVTETLLPGTRVSVLAILRPPPPPSMPGAFDFQRRAFFQGIGAYGFILGPVDIIGESPDSDGKALVRRIETLRLQISKRVHHLQDNDSGAVAAALMTGHRSFISEEVLQDMRDAGIAHLLAISGLHIGLVAGIVFATVRLLLALVPIIGLRNNTKKTAAWIAIPAAFAYAVLAGLTVPTERAFLMTGLMLTGILIDRRALSMRSVCWAAIVILLLRPESLVGPGFQMSFAAVTALIATYAWLARRRRLKPRLVEPGLIRKCMGYLGGVLLTTVVASAATAPFAIYHFQHVSAFGLITNAIAVPLAALWVMPAGIATLLAMPLGWDALPLKLMCMGIDWILQSAHLFAGLPGAAADVSAPPAWSLGLCVLAGLWLALWQTRWRFYAVPVLAVALGGPLFGQPPDMIIDGEARTIAVSDGVTGLRTSNGRAARFEVETWQRRLGYDEKPKPWQDNAEQTQGRLRCDADGCTVAVGTRRIVIALNETPLHDDCQLSDMLVAMVPVRGRCQPPWGVIDRFDLWRGGTHSIRFSDTGPVILTVNGERGLRPWVIAPE